MMHSKRWQHWLLAACCAWVPVAAVAQVEAGSEGMISADGDYPTLAARGDAHALAWKSDYGIWGCLFRTDNVIEFGAGAANATLPQLGMNAEGDLVLAWQGTDGAGAGVFARRFRASGALQGSEFRVNRTTAGNQTKPRLAVAPGGSFAIGWEDEVRGDDALRIAGFGADGRGRGRPLVLRTAGPANLLGGVGASDQGFAAGWTEVRQCTGGALDLTAAVTTFTSAMRQQGNVQRFNDGSQCSAGPTLAGVPSSEFGPLAVMDGHQLTVQRFAPLGGARVGARTVVANFDACAPTGRCERVVAVAGDDRGRVVVVTEVRFIDSGTGALRYHLFGQLFGREGRARSPYFQITGEASTAEQHAAAALTDNGELFTAWRRSGASPGLIVRNFQLGGALFED